MLSAWSVTIAFSRRFSSSMPDAVEDLRTLSNEPAVHAVDEEVISLDSSALTK
jgi:hypothetical protein